jgi:glycosyltransferase involved in cell wall biosynthesis
VIRRLTIVRGSGAVSPADGGEVLPFEQLREWVQRGAIWRHVFRYNDVTLRTERVESLTRPLVTALLVRSLSRGRCVIIDDGERSTSITLQFLARLASRFLIDLLAVHGVRLAVEREVSDLTHGAVRRSRLAGATALSFPIYLRTDSAIGLRSGGSVGHIAGVLNSFEALADAPLFFSTDRIPTVGTDIETHVIRPDGRFRDFPEIPELAFNERFASEVRRLVGPRRVSFIYQRYSTDDYAGAQLARHWAVPFVLEYNGSEVWVNRNWGRPLKYERLGLAVEVANLHAADLIVVVSQVIFEELVGRGIGAEKILVNPNGVDPERYRPSVDGMAIRAKLGLDGKVVIGFIGTFGPWHGAETLAEAFGLLLANRPDFRGWVRLLMIGDGARLEATRQEIATGGVKAETVFAGRTAQEDGPAYLAACDILASPHVPNADGSRFFGSPTKLFEYMAMGRAIVASRLEQIGEVLEDDRTAVLVEPGDAAGLAKALEALVGDPERRARLGAAAREEAVANHTWLDHTRRILDRIDSIGA